MSLPAIRCQNLTKTYPGKPPVEAVRGVDLLVEQGECFGLLGPNGAGKTTTVEILEGLMPPSGGEVEVLGLSWQRDAHAIRQQIGVTLQETRLDEKLTVKETVRLFRSFYSQGVSPESAIALVSLEEKADVWIKKLSGGQRQRLAVAIAIVGTPRILFLDEPTTGLDPQSRRDLWKLINDCRDRGTTVLLTTHYMEEAERLCDRVAIVDGGKIITSGTPRDLIASLGSRHIVEFSLAEENGSESFVQSFSDMQYVAESIRVEDRIQLSVSQPHLVIPSLIQRLEINGDQLASLTTRQATLEDVFVKVAGHTIDEAEALVRERDSAAGASS